MIKQDVFSYRHKTEPTSTSVTDMCIQDTFSYRHQTEPIITSVIYVIRDTLYKYL